MGIHFRWLLYTCLVLPLWSHTLAINEKVIQVDNFLANVNLSEPKLFYVRNNLDVSHHFNVFISVYNRRNINSPISIF